MFQSDGYNKVKILMVKYPSKAYTIKLNQGL